MATTSDLQPHSPARSADPSANTPTIGIIGGGQLSRMLCQAAAQLGIRTATVEKKADCPAATVSRHHQVGNWNEPSVLLELAEHCDVVTLENEFVESQALAKLEQANIPVYPSSRCLNTIQDKLRQKETLHAAQLPTPRFRNTESFAELEQAAKEYGFPFLLKRRRNGYDGKGNYTVKDQADLTNGWQHLGGDENPLFAEEFCNFKSEIAVMVCRSINGETIVYPVVETIQKDHICHTVKAPAQVSEATRELAIQIAQDAVNAVEGTGSLGVELFLTPDDRIVLNELAPRVHNSGHYTIEACQASQFENHIRAILGLPLGNPALIKPSAVMVNLLGDASGSAYPKGVENALNVDGAHLHLYGKDQSQKGRKMGHITVIGDSIDETFDRAKAAANQITFNEQS